jgi:nucleoside-diphosphate-sugar epimerase
VILVSGGSGFLGSHLVAALVEREHAVRVLSRRPLSEELRGRGVSGALGDLRDPSTLPPALEGVDAVVHLAAVTPSTARSRAEFADVNGGGTKAIARSAKAAEVRRFVHMSSAGVYGDNPTDRALAETSAAAPVTPYQESKLAGEKELVAELSDSQVAWAILRPFWIYGPGSPGTMDFLRRVQKRRLWLYSATRVALHPTYVGDVVNAVLSALERLERPDVRSQVFNIGGERSVDHFELVQLAARRLHVPVYRLALPQAAAPLMRILSAAGGPSRFRYRTVSYVADTDKARRALDFTPFPLAQGLDETVRWAKTAGLQPH